ncbi:Putative signal peptide protein (fragment) [Magnetospirillum molischianum DSM 120]|uniref:Putative signal peptide protein n=1 Tax=Magnetospirillum molischianum DSM 120 TaxID=1150626 RepID=H8FVP0_MAGML
MVKIFTAALLCTALSGCIIQPMHPGRTVYYEPAYAPPPVYYAAPPPPRFFAPGGGYGHGHRYYPPPHSHFRPWR